MSLAKTDDVQIDKDQGWLRVQSVIDQHRIATSYNLTVARQDHYKF